jgi:hypothetical protein
LRCLLRGLRLKLLLLLCCELLALCLVLLLEREQVNVVRELCRLDLLVGDVLLLLGLGVSSQLLGSEL